MGISPGARWAMKAVLLLSVLCLAVLFVSPVKGGTQTVPYTSLIPGVSDVLTSLLRQLPGVTMPSYIPTSFDIPTHLTDSEVASLARSLGFTPISSYTFTPVGSPESGASLLSMGGVLVLSLIALLM